MISGSVRKTVPYAYIQKSLLHVIYSVLQVCLGLIRNYVEQFDNT